MNKHISIFIFGFIMLFSLQLPLDLDLGWHLRYGQYFFQTGHVLKQNIFSIVWPLYHWVQASWGYDLILYQLFHFAGFWGISFAASLTTIIIFWIIARPFSTKSIFTMSLLTLIFLTQTEPLYIAGFRSQTLSSLCFALLLICIQPHALQKKISLVILPLLFFLWANTHGGFLLGLLLLTITWIVNSVVLIVTRTMHRKNFVLPGLTVALSWITPIANPWGLQLYNESFRHSTNNNLAHIGEWMPLTSSLVETIIASIVACMVLAVFIKQRRKSDFAFILCFMLVTYLGFSALRFMINFGIMATWYLAKTNGIQPIIINKFNHIIQRIGVVVVCALFIFDFTVSKRYFVFSVPTLVNFSWSTYCDILGTCSEEITQLMLKNPPGESGLNPYNYGGYLIWRVPVVKTFSDGRMSAWEQNNLTPLAAITDIAYAEKQPIAFRQLDERYHFSWVIVPSDSPLTQYMNSLAKTAIWRQTYADSRFRYYQKNP